MDVISQDQSKQQAYSEINRRPRDVCGHYQVPSQSKLTAPTVNDELNQLIETKRKRTLMMLKSKEAPKASFELTSPLEPELPSLERETSHHLTPDDPSDQHLPPSDASHYENLHLDGHEPDIEAPGDDQQVIVVTNNSVVSPSESQNFQTLSLVSDGLGDLSQEENSLVQQLGPS